MFLYNLSLTKPGSISCLVYGNFSGAKKSTEILVARGDVLELLRADEQGKVHVVLSTRVFGTVRSLATFRFTGAPKDYVAVGSDSGRIVVLEYDKESNVLDKLHQETFGKSGCRRNVPGQYVACDPKGRAAMIGAVEKQKFVYVFNRDAQARLTISSPLEAHRQHTLCLDLVALDVGFENPIFAAIELDYADADQDPTGGAARAAQKTLAFYELDLGLNHVSRTWSDPVDNGANKLLAVPGGGDGPGGVIVFAENFVVYKNQGHPDLRAVIPRRADLAPSRGLLVVSAAMHKQKNLFFALAQSEYGDVYKVSLEYMEETVTELRISYFDTIPVTSSLCVLRTGFLFAAAEFGDHGLYQFAGIGDDEADAKSSSLDAAEAEGGGYVPVLFRPRPLKNLVPVDDLESMCPLTGMAVADLHGEETPQVYALCGRGHRSSLRVLRPGLSVAEMAVSPLPGNPTAVWTVRKSMADAADSYIVVSFVNATLVLAVGETVEEVSDSGFLGTVPTLSVNLMSDDSMLQVHPGGLRHIRADRRINEWKTPGRKQISKVAVNSSQVVVAMTGGELVYFELDALGQLDEKERRDMAADIACLDIAPVPEGRQRAPFLAVGAYDSTVRIFSLDPASVFEPKAMQATPSPPSSVLLFPFSAGAGSGGRDATFMAAGLENGVLLRTEVDASSGELSDLRSRFLGSRAVKLFRTVVRGRLAMLCLSARPWLGYSWQGRFQLAPLSYDTLEHAAPFASAQCPEGFVAVSAGTLRIAAIDRLGDAFNAASTPLSYTPRGMCIHPKHKTIAIVEADMRAPTEADRLAARKAAVGIAPAPSSGGAEGEDGDVKPEVGDGGGMEVDGGDGAGAGGGGEPLADDQLGQPKGEAGEWASCVRVMTADGECTHRAELPPGEAALACCTVKFAGRDEGTVLAVATASKLSWFPRSAEAGHVRIYRFVEEGRKLDLLHATEVKGGVPSALAAFQGKLLVGAGTTLRLYDMGKRKLLRKCEARSFPTAVRTIQVKGDRIYVGDAHESFHYCLYRAAENQIYTFADDTVPRHVTAAAHMDYDTVAGGDKFGNVFVARLPAETSDAVEEDPTGGRSHAETSTLGGAPYKLEEVIQFHVGPVVTALSLATMQPGGGEVLLYGTVSGSLGAMIPFLTRDDVDYFAHLEMHMRAHAAPLCGNDHLAYRSYYFPVKDVIDGDLCEMYASLDHEAQVSIARQLDRTPGEVLKKIEDMRNRCL